MMWLYQSRRSRRNGLTDFKLDVRPAIAKAESPKSRRGENKGIAKTGCIAKERQLKNKKTTQQPQARVGELVVSAGKCLSRLSSTEK
jgi:hypothetical protein